MIAPSAKNLCREIRNKAPLGANSEAITASLTSSTLLGSARTAARDSTKALSDQIASSCETNSTLYRVQSRLSREAKSKALYTNSKAIAASLASTILLESAKSVAREANTKVPLHANSNVDSASLPLTAPSTKNLCRGWRQSIKC